MVKTRVDTVSGDEQAISLQMDRLWRPVFDKYDTNKDGIIECQQFKRILKESNNHLSEDIPEEVLDEMIEKSDICRDGVITYEEFLKMIHARDLGAQRPRLHRLIRYAAMAVVPRSQRRSIIRRYLEDYNCMPPPLFLLVISVLEVSVFIYYCVDMGSISAIGPVPWKSTLIYDPCKRQEAWRFITYMLIHAGFVHIFFNIVVQLILGIPLEMVHKWWRVGTVYLAGVAAGSLGANISDPFSYLAGASGGVYALISAHLASVVINWSEMEFNWLRLAGLVLFGGTDIGVAIYGRYTDDTQNRTSYAAHLAGAVAGFLVGINVLRNLRVRRWETILGWFALVIYIMLMGFAIIYNIVNKDHYINQENTNQCLRSEYHDSQQHP
ncbi:rhomboid-related protein 2-like [Oppia nitens]|uniref:rhomboid-related protein 2-like n=1 Tax=Oppia nitens TaxID=1686743 RepID=UPI0023DCE9DE|nr:rhomboid-related protein 2-like [Oppia nitens]